MQVGSIGSDVELPANLIMAEELRYMGSFRYADVYRPAMDLITTRRVDIRPLISATYTLSESRTAFGEDSHPPGGAACRPGLAPARPGYTSCVRRLASDVVRLEQTEISMRDDEDEPRMVNDTGAHSDP